MEVATPAPTPCRFKAETAGLDLLPLPGQYASELCLKLAVTECHTWVGIGGACRRLRRPRILTRETSRLLQGSCGGPDYLLSGESCRFLVRKTMVNELGSEFRAWRLPRWDDIVPKGVEELILERARARRGGASCEYEVDIRVRVDLVYSEVDALLLQCEPAAGPWTASDGDGAAPECSICYAELAPGASALVLPGCAHGFHRQCIGKWFEKKPTCPMCRHDVLQYLPPGYRAVHDVMHAEAAAGGS